MYPMTIASQVAHLVMKMQQDVADLVNKGDETLESLFPPRDEQPEWATFDEDVTDEMPEPAAQDGERLTEGRFALFTGGEPETKADGEPETKADGEPETNTDGEVTMVATDLPEVVTRLDYETLTLAQLRARLSTLRVADLEELLSYEESTKSRAPFQTLLANRITRANSK
jgi:hypothetical protein